jgi:hypothetical protein
VLTNFLAFEAVWLIAVDFGSSSPGMIMLGD